MSGTHPSTAALAVASKHEDIATKHNNSIDQVEELRHVALDDMLPAVLQDMGLESDTQAESRSRSFLNDRATLFRFYRRGRYSEQGALSLLTSTLSWRLRTDLDSLSLSSLHPLYVSPPARPPLFWCNTRCKDKLGRPVGVISLGSLERTVKGDGDNGLNECREYIVGCMESVRRYLSNLYGKGTETSRVIDIQDDSSEPPKPLQMVIIFSLQSSGMANLELELLPFLLDLLKNHFPGMVGAVYIVHYGWVHSGMWALAKRVLPQQALARIFFPSEKELPEHFDLDNLPSCLGGDWDVELDEDTNDVMKRFARPNLQGVLYRNNGGRGTAEEPEWESNSAPPSPRGISGTSSPVPGWSSRALSRSGSFDSLADKFYSSHNTPWHLTPRASQTPTPHNETIHFASSFDGSTSPVAPMLRMTPTAAKKLQQLQITRERASRKRTNSDANRKFLTEDISMIRQGRSPIMSRGSSPTRQRRRALTSQGVRNVHFQADKPEGSQGTKAGETMSRRGSLRDFRLLQGDYETTELGGDSSGSEQSDKSGKVGESTKDINRQRQGSVDDGKSGGFFARWRGSSKVEATAKEENSTTKREPNDLVELESIHMPSPQLQVPDIEEPPLSGFTPLSGASQIISRRSRKFSSLPGHVSPYNASNPFYGYPAYPISSEDDTARRQSLYNPHHHNDNQRRLQYQRRKRDLLRTLVYLFVLRLLSMHRGVRNQILAGYRGFVRAARVGGLSEEAEEEEGWKEANERYNRLKSASLRYEKDRTGQQSSKRPRQAQAQPLVQLGFRKRYAFLILFLFIIARRDWRSRLQLNLRELLGFAGLGKVGLDSVSQEKGEELSSETTKLAGLDVEARVSSITGLHLRRRLGWQ